MTFGFIFKVCSKGNGEGNSFCKPSWVQGLVRREGQCCKSSVKHESRSSHAQPMRYRPLC